VSVHAAVAEMASAHTMANRLEIIGFLLPMLGAPLGT
jgi:hypothetical protein